MKRKWIKMCIYIMIQYCNYQKVVSKNISSRWMHWHGGFPSLPADIAVSSILDWPRRIFWNLKCLSLSLLALSHFRTRYPTWNYLSPATCLSNHLLILCWWIWNFSFALFLSSFNFKTISIQVWRKLEDQPREDWASWSDCK